MPKHVSRMRVRYAETDQMGVVYYANYLIWMEVGRVELVRSLGLEYKQLEHTEGLLSFRYRSQLPLLYPARYDQEIAVETMIGKATNRLVEFRYRISSVEPERLLAEGSTRHIWLNKEFRPARLPVDYQSKLQIG